MNYQNLKSDKRAASVVSLLFLILISINCVSAQPGGTSNVAPASETEIQIKALANRREALGKVASKLFTVAGKLPDGSWEQGKLIADAKREYQIGLAEANAVEQMTNLAFTAADREKIADHRRVYTLVIKSFDGMIAKSIYKEDGSRTSGFAVSEKYKIYLKELDPVRAEITTLTEEIRKNTATSARNKEIYASIEQNSLKILAVNTDVLKYVEREPDSADKNILKKFLDEDIAAMKSNLASVTGEKYRESVAGATPAVISGGATMPQIGSVTAVAPEVDPLASFMANFKKFAIEDKGRSIVDEGIADKIEAFAMSPSSRLTVDASSSKHFTLYVISDDPTFDVFFYLNGQFMNTPVDTGRYYVTPRKITKLSDTYNLYAYTMGFNNESRSISYEFRGDKAGKVRYMVALVKTGN